MDYGLTATGFVPKTLEIILDDLTAAVRSVIGVLPTGTLLKFLGILAERYAELWELLELVYASQDPDSVAGQAQDALNAITGTTREAAKESTVTLTLTGTPLTLVPDESKAKRIVTGDKFQTIGDVTIIAATTWVTATAYVAGDRRTNAGRVYVCIIGGTSGSGPTTTAEDITDNTAHWRYIGEGTGVVDVAAKATVTGPVEAISGEITEIDTPVVGWESVKNLRDADVGSDIESNEEYRVRREEELAQAGTGTGPAIRAAMRDPNNVPGVISVTVFVNDTDLTDVDGMPPKSVEVLIRGGEDADIGQVLLDNVSGGIETYGNTSVFVTDDEGFEQELFFSRPIEKLIYVDATYVKIAAKYPSDGDAQTKASIVAYGDEQESGVDVVASRLFSEIFKTAGVKDVTQVLISVHPTNPPVSSTTITIAPRELAVFDTSRITLHTSNGTP